MMSLPALISFFESSKYTLLFIGAFFEGPTVMLAAGILWNLGTVEFVPTYIALLLGDVLGDVMWYVIGYHATRPFLARFGHVFGMNSEIVEKVKRRFHQYHTKILVISKLTMGFGLAVPILIVAGMLHVPFTRYLSINLLGGLVWTAFVMGVGYYFGNVLAYIPQDLQSAIAFGIVLLFFLMLRTVSKKLSTIDW